jgi:hypothetical protein
MEQDQTSRGDTMELEVTWRRSFRFWWAIWWRFAIFYIVFGFVLAIGMEFFTLLILVPLNIDPMFGAILFKGAELIIPICFTIYLHKQFILRRKIGDFITILVDEVSFRALKESNLPITLGDAPEKMITWGRSLRLWWAIAWKTFVLTLIFNGFMVLLIIIISKSPSSGFHSVLSALWVIFIILFMISIAYFGILVQRSFVFGKKIGDFVTIMVDPVQYQAQQETHLPPPPPLLPGQT